MTTQSLTILLGYARSEPSQEQSRTLARRLASPPTLGSATILPFPVMLEPIDPAAFAAMASPATAPEVHQGTPADTSGGQGNGGDGDAPALEKPKRLITIEEVLMRVPVTRQTMFNWERTDRFPRRIDLDGRACWLESEIDDWIDNHARPKPVDE